METDILSRSVAVAKIHQPPQTPQPAQPAPSLPPSAKSNQQTRTQQRMWLLSESEEDLLSADNLLTPHATDDTSAAPRKVAPIRVKVTKRRNVAPTQQKILRAIKRPRVSKSRLTQVAASTSEVTPSAPQPNDSRLADAGTRRLQLRDAIDMVGKLYDELVAHRTGGGQPARYECNLEVLRILCLRKLVLESLTNELTKRNVLPVTLNTLSNLFVQSYLRVF
jgi:hypothetical protein